MRASADAARPDRTGRNALLSRGEPITAEVQRRNVRIAAAAIAPIAEHNELVITHGNGPQTAAIVALADLDELPPLIWGIASEEEAIMSSRLSRCVATLLLVAFPTLSCQTLADKTRENPKAVLGSLGGAVVGGGIAAVAGASSGWIVAATLAGGLLGGAIGHRLDNKDKQMAAEAAARAFESNRTGQSAGWKNPDSGNSGTITPTKTYQAGSGQYCREYRQEVTIGGEKQQAYGTACRQPDGTWQIQS